MFTLFILGLVAAGLVFAAVPVILYALMLETCGERAHASARDEKPTVRPPRYGARGHGLALAA